MPRVPVLNTKTQISTNVPGMQATPANTATSRAVSGLASTVSNLAFQVANKQQKEKDSTGEFELKNTLSKASYDFDTQNANRIDINGEVDGIAYDKAKVDTLTKVKDENLEKYRGTVSAESLEVMQLTSKNTISNASSQANRSMKTISSKKARVKGRELVKDSIANVTSSGNRLHAYTALQSSDKYQIDRSDNYSVDESIKARKEAASGISFGLTQGELSHGNYLEAVKTAGLENDEEILSTLPANDVEVMRGMSGVRNLGGNMTAAQRTKVKNQVISAVRTKDALALRQLKEAEASISAKVAAGNITLDETKEIYNTITPNSNKLTPIAYEKFLSDAATNISLAELGDTFQSKEPSEWASDAKEISNTIADPRAKKVFDSKSAALINSRIKEMNTNFANYQSKADPAFAKAELMAIDPDNQEGAIQYFDMLFAKGKTYKMGSGNINITPTSMKNLYAPALKSNNTDLQLEALAKLENHVGKYSDKILSEIVDNPGIAAAANISDKTIARTFLTAFNKGKDFDKEYSSWVALQDNDSWVSSKEGYSGEVDTVVKSFNSSEFFDVLNQMSDKRNLNAHMKAAEITYKQMLMSNIDEDTASEAVENMFTGANGKYQIISNSDGLTSKLLLPRNNSAGLSQEQAQIAMEKVKDDYKLYDDIINIDKSKFITSGAFNKDVRFSQSKDGIGLSLLRADSSPVRDDNNAPIVLSWSELLEISSREKEEQELVDVEKALEGFDVLF